MGSCIGAMGVKEQTYNWPLSNGFGPGTMLRLRGTVPTGGKLFHINFQTNNDYNTSDIIFHASIRPSESIFVMNNKDSGKWMSEQRINTSAIVTGREFEILIACEQKQFRVAINGFHLADFPMRRAHTLIKALSVIGQVNVVVISFENSKSSQPTPQPYGSDYPFPR